MADQAHNTLAASMENPASSSCGVGRGQRATPQQAKPTVPDENATANESPLVETKPRVISERKLQANRRNAQKSTGPCTAWGKTSSSRNSLKHGMRSKSLLFGPDGAPIDADLRALWTSLREEQEAEQVLADPLQTVMAELSHQGRAIELEQNVFQNGLDDSRSLIAVRHLLRYRTASRRALTKNLRLLQNTAFPSSDSEER
jgi:hypothetical protein